MFIHKLCTVGLLATPKNKLGTVGYGNCTFPHFPRATLIYLSLNYYRVCCPSGCAKLVPRALSPLPPAPVASCARGISSVRAEHLLCARISNNPISTFRAHFFCGLVGLVTVMLEKIR